MEGRWFNGDNIEKKEPIFINDLNGYSLPHAGTEFTGRIISDTLRFRPVKRFKNIVIIYLPATELPDINDKYYHEYYVPMMSLKLFYPKKKYIGFNVLKDHKKKLKGFNKSNSLFIISSDSSHWLEMEEALPLENCSAQSICFKELKNNECIKVIDDVRSFRF